MEKKEETFERGKVTGNGMEWGWRMETEQRLWTNTGQQSKV